MKIQNVLSVVKSCNQEGLAMLKAFTRNYEDNSTEAGFQFTFYCDICQDGYKTSFVESETHKKNSKIRGIGQGVWAVSTRLAEMFLTTLAGQ